MVITEKYHNCLVGSVFSLLSAEDREKLKRVSDSAKQVAAGQTALHTLTQKESISHETSSKSSDVSTDGEYMCRPELVS